MPTPTDPPFPRTPDIHPELRTFCEDMRADMQEVKIALVGNRYGQVGLIKEVAVVKEKVEGHDRKFLVWGSILSFAGTALVFLKDYLRTR